MVEYLFNPVRKLMRHAKEREQLREIEESSVKAVGFKLRKQRER